MTTAGSAVPTDVTEARTYAENWVSRPALAEVVAQFGGDLDAAPRGLAARLAWLDAFSDRWDSRQGDERNLAGELDLTPAQCGATMAAAAGLGMIEAAAPTSTDYDHAVALGGMVRACVNRPAHVAHLRERGVAFGRITALGGHRPFQGDEFELAERAGLGDVNEEYAALDAGTRRAFALTEPEAAWGESSELVGGSWGVRRYRLADGTVVDVAAAPSTEPVKRRADTPDTYRWFARELADLAPGQTVLAVTTPIYLVAQHVAAIRMLVLPFGVRVETVGNDPALVPPALRQDFTPSRYLQEIRSAVRALRSLVDDLSAT